MSNPFVGPSYNLASRPAGVQRTINMMPVPLEPGNDRSGWVFKDVPGLVRMAQPAPALPLLVDLNALTYGGASAAVGLTVSGLNPATVYTVSLPPGQLYVAWQGDPFNYPTHFCNIFSVTTAGGVTKFGTYTGGGLPFDFSTAAAARAGFPGGTLTGYASYTFWIDDYPNMDNAGGLSILLTPQ